MHELDGDVDAACRLGIAAAASADKVGDPLIATLGLAMAALGSAHHGDVDAGERWAARALEVATASQSPLALGWARYAMGEVVLESDPDAALAHEAAAVEHADEAGSPLLRGIAGLSDVSVRSRQSVSDDASAVAGYAELIRRWQLAGMWAHQWATLRNLAEAVCRARGDESAAVLYGAVSGRYAPVSAHGAEAERLTSAATQLRQRLGAEAFERGCAKGASMTPDEVVDAALAIVDP